MKKILVTGGAGFIGSQLCERLLEGGDEVVCIDNLFTSRRENIAHLLGHRCFEFIRHDVCEPWHIECDRIYHLACPASPVHYQRNPVRTIETAVLGTRNALECARSTGARLLITSTSEVYGDPEEHPQRETYVGHVNTLGPRACYDEETEILTEHGWMRFADLRAGIRVATLNSINAVEYHVPDEIISYHYVGQLLRFANSKYDFCVTPNHRMYVVGKTGKYKFLRADEDRFWHGWRAPTTAKFESEDIEWMDLGEPPRNAKTRLGQVRMDDWLEFYGYYVSEGCVHIRRRVREVGGRDYDVADYNILIAQVDEHGRSMISHCLNRIGWNFFDSDDHQFRICSAQLAAMLTPLGKSGDKFLPREYLRLSRRQSRILLDALILGDGSRRTDTASTYYTKSKRLADDVQELALRCGFAATISLTPGRDLYRVNIRSDSHANLVSPQNVHYSGLVWCVDVKNHVICVRRSGRAAWCGNCYDEGKRVGESLAVSWASQFGTDVRIARLFNTYGPRMAFEDGRLIPNFVLQAMRGKPLTLYGSGEQTRSFCYVRDTVDGIMKFMGARREVFPAAEIPVINIGNPDERTIASVASDVIAAFGSGTTEHRPLPADDPKQRCPDITRAKMLLGWEPKTNYKDGIRETIAWFREQSVIRATPPTPTRSKCSRPGYQDTVLHTHNESEAEPGSAPRSSYQSPTVSHPKRKLAFLFDPWACPRPIRPSGLFTDARGLTGSEISCVMQAIEMRKLGHEVTIYSNFSEDGEDRGIRFARWDHWQREAGEDRYAVVAFIHPQGLQQVKKGVLRVFNQQVNDFQYCLGWEAFVDVATSPSPHHQKYLSPLTKFSNWRILPNGCDASVHGDGERNRSIVYASSPDRGLHWVLELFPRLKKRVPDVECHVYYDYRPGLDKIYEQLGEKELAKRFRYIETVMPQLASRGVFHHKSVSREDMAKVLCESRLLAYPCDPVRYTEGFSCTTLEAGSAGCLPVICAADALGEIYADYLPSVAAPYAGHRDEYFELLVRYLTDDAAYVDAQKKARQLGNLYDWSTVGRRLQSILEDRAT